MIKALLLLDEDYPTNAIEKITSVKIGRLNHYIQIYLKYGLEELLECDKKNKYNIHFKMRTSGWMNLCFEFDNLNMEIHLSSVFDPIPDLLQLLSEINNNKDSMMVIIDEEGHFKKILLNKLYVIGSHELYELKITSDDFPFNEYEFKKVIYKDIFQKKLLDAFIKLADGNKKTVWYNYKLSEFINNNIKNIVGNINEEKRNCT
jgi:hypothetical protein